MENKIENMNLESPELTHLKPNAMPRMVDVGEKGVTCRSATARGTIQLPSSLSIVAEGDGEIVTKKGSVIHTSIVAGTLAVKRTSDLIPFCHPLPIEGIDFNYRFLDDRKLEITCTVSLSHKTGVEMEALTGVSVALLTIYDMCKSAGQDMVIEGIEVVKKTGGKSDIEKQERT